MPKCLLTSLKFVTIYSTDMISSSVENQVETELVKYILGMQQFSRSLLFDSFYGQKKTGFNLASKSLRFQSFLLLVKSLFIRRFFELVVRIKHKCKRYAS